MAKTKLSQEQNASINGLSVQEKLVLLHQWRKNGKITEESYQYHLNRWIREEGIKFLKTKKSDPVCFAETMNEEMHTRKSLAAKEIETFIHYLRNKINLYIKKRSFNAVALHEEDYKKFESLIAQYHSTQRKLINELLILGLRYPDKSKMINFCCSEFIEENKKNDPIDYFFWGMLWEDQDFVPIDAVRLMLKPSRTKYEIDPRFEPSFIKSIIPLMEAQRDKEILRFQAILSLEGDELDKQRDRKIDRLAPFNMLIMAAEEYCKNC